MSEQLSFHYIAAALRYRYGREATTVAFRQTDLFRQKGDGERATLWTKVVEQLVEPSAREWTDPLIGG